MPKDGTPRERLMFFPYIMGKMAVAQMMGKGLIEKNMKFDQTEKFSDEFVEFVAASTQILNFLSGVYDAIDEGFGVGEVGAEGMFRIVAGKNDKASRKRHDQIELLQKYIAKSNASKVARETGRPLKTLNRWRKKGHIVDAAKASVLLGTDVDRYDEKKKTRCRRLGRCVTSSKK